MNEISPTIFDYIISEQGISSTLEGPLRLLADPFAPLDAATKQYVDSFLGKPTAIISPTSPENPSPGDLWRNFSDGELYIWDSDAEIWIIASQGVREAPQRAGAFGRDYGEWIPVLPLRGGEMSGTLTLAHDPTFDRMAATKHYVDVEVGKYLPLDGGELKGPVFGPYPTSPNQLVTKAYVDARDVVTTITVSDVPPTGPVQGQLWFDSVGVQTYIWYIDGLGAWVPVSTEAFQDGDDTAGTGGGGITEAPTDGQTYGRDGALQSWLPVLPLSGGTLTGQLILDGTLASDPNEAVSKTYVDSAVATGSLWQGNYIVATNSPGLNFLTPVNGASWTAITKNPGIAEALTITLPGLPAGTLINNGDLIRYNAPNNTWYQIAASGLTQEVADETYVIKAGDTMEGSLILAADPTQPLEAATKEYADRYAVTVASLSPGGPYQGQLWFDTTRTSLYIWEELSTSAAWVAIGGSGIPDDAPHDGNTYGRQNGAWFGVLPSSGGILSGPLTIQYNGEAYTQQIATDGTFQFQDETGENIFSYREDIGLTLSILTPYLQLYSENDTQTSLVDLIGYGAGGQTNIVFQCPNQGVYYQLGIIDATRFFRFRDDGHSLDIFHYNSDTTNFTVSVGLKLTDINTLNPDLTWGGTASGQIMMPDDGAIMFNSWIRYGTRVPYYMVDGYAASIMFDKTDGSLDINLYASGLLGEQVIPAGGMSFDNNGATKFNGQVTISAGVQPTLYLNTTDPKIQAGLRLQMLGVDRWVLHNVPNAENGNNTGSDFALGRYDDAGVYISDFMNVKRNTGNAHFSGDIAVNGDLAVYQNSAGVFPINPIGGAFTTNLSNGSLETDFVNAASTAVDAFRWYQQTTALAAWWSPDTAYAVNDQRQNNTNIYNCTQAGTSAHSGGPTGTGTGIVDNTCLWDYVGPVVAAGTMLLQLTASGALNTRGPLSVTNANGTSNVLSITGSAGANGGMNVSMTSSSAYLTFNVPNIQINNALWQMGAAQFYSDTTFRANIGFFGVATAGQQVITGSRTDGTALASLITALATFGLVVDTTSA
jgi:hypothetical protein